MRLGEEEGETALGLDGEKGFSPEKVATRKNKAVTAGKATNASRNVDRRVDLSFTSVGSRDHELRLSQMHRRGVAA